MASQPQAVTDFDRFWAAYPRRTAKFDAQKAWSKLNPPIDEVLAALEWQRQEWTDPQFIPYPATWLRAGRWMDERPDRAVVSATAAKVLRLVGGDR